MLYREIIAVCSQIHTKHTNALCGQNVGLLNVKLAVYIVTTGFRGFRCDVIAVILFVYIYAKSPTFVVTVEQHNKSSLMLFLDARNHVCGD